MTLTVVAPAFARAMIGEDLPADVEMLWYRGKEEALALAPRADAGWLDVYPLADRVDVIAAATRLKWLSTITAGLDALPTELLRQRGVRVTNGSGLNSEAVADYTAMGVLALAKGFAQIVRAHDRREWLMGVPGVVELGGARVLIIGYGTIGRMLGDRLGAFGMSVTGATRRGGQGTLAADQWRARLSEFDWVILTAPSTDATRAMIGGAELAAMKPGGRLLNVARGDPVDQDALVAALESSQLGGALLDVTDPEPLPPDHPLWTASNCIVTMHLSGRSDSYYPRGARRFAENLHRYLAGEPLVHEVDLALGY